MSECVRACEGDFSAEREGLRKQRGEEGGVEDEHLLENILFFVESKRVRIKEMPIKTAFRKTRRVQMVKVGTK